jgi:hypothetical protein
MKRSLKFVLLGVVIIPLLCIVGLLNPPSLLTGILVISATIGIFTIGWKKVAGIAAAGIIGILLAIGVFKLAAQVEYTRIDHLTDQHSAEMLPAIKQSVNKTEHDHGRIFTNTVDYVKVFEVKADMAKVFVTTNYDLVDVNGFTMTDRSGAFYFLMRENEKWIIDPTRSVNEIWDEKGSSDRMTWPPYQ